MNPITEAMQEHLYTSHQFPNLMYGTLGKRTAWGQYHQALREIHGRIQGMAAYKKLVEEKKNNCKTLFDQIDLAEISRQEKECEREARYLAAVILHHRATFAGITQQKRDQLDLEAWVHDIKMESAAGIIACGRIPQNVAGQILGLPSEVKRHLIPEIKNADALLSWAENYQAPVLPEPHSISLPESVVGEIKCLSQS